MWWVAGLVVFFVLCIVAPFLNSTDDFWFWLLLGMTEMTQFSNPFSWKRIPFDLTGGLG